jgi:hypothetical protein
LPPAALDQGRQSHSEKPVHADDDGITRFDQIDQDRFHSGRAGAGQGEGESIVGVEHLSKQGLCLVENGQERGIEMADERHGHGMQNPWMDHAWPRTEQDPRRGIEFPDGCGCHAVLPFGAGCCS